MAMGKGLLLLLCTSACVTVQALPNPRSRAPAEAPVLLTLEWPPYTGLKLSENGPVTERVRAIYAALGEDVKVGFFSWRRAMHLPASDRRFIAYFPAYPTLQRQHSCHLSAPVGGSSPLGVAQRRSQPLHWRQAADLAAYRMGVVTDYANEDTFDRLVQEGRIQTLSSESDADNLFNLATGKVDGAIIDQRVFAWLMQHDVRLQPYRDQLQLHERLLATWPLVLCFRKNAEGAAERDRFNAGLERLQMREAAKNARTRTATNGD